MQKSFPMGEGDGNCKDGQPNNTVFLKEVMNTMKDKIKEEIDKKLELKELVGTSTSFNLADLGCSVGPNTIICMENVIEALKLKYKSQGLDSPHQMPEFQVFFNDLTFNDFNALFRTLPPEKTYFAAGVPGSFHGRLFPKSFIHFLHCSHALQFLSQVPKEVQDENSPAWNKGRIHYINAPQQVCKAYSDQFAKDFGTFLDARAVEMAAGGIMALTLAPIRDGIARYPTLPDLAMDGLGSCLMDMAKEGLLSEAQVDSFNMPVYIACLEEITELLERNGCFKIERTELLDVDASLRALHGQARKMHLRNFEPLLNKHFGNEIMDELFDRFSKKADDIFSAPPPSSYRGTYQMFLALKRK